MCTTRVQLFFPATVSIEVFFERGVCFVHLHFPAECPFTCSLFYKRPFPVPYLLHQRLSQHYLAIFEFSFAIRAACMIHLSVVLNTFVVFLTVPRYTWALGGLPILQSKFLLAHGCHRPGLLSPGSFPPKVTLVTLASRRCSFGGGGGVKW